MTLVVENWNSLLPQPTKSIVSDLIVRPAVVADLEPMAIVRRCPLVQKNQYWLAEAFWLDFSESVIRAHESGFSQFHVLQVSDQVVGFVTVQSVDHGASKCGYFAFNLLPEYWGQGLMEKALRSIFTEFFQDDQNQGAMIECFSGNRQCRRLLQKMFFSQISIPILERISCWTTRSPIRWVLRFWLSQESWSQYANLANGRLTDPNRT